MYNEEFDEKIDFFKKKENDLSDNELNYKIGQPMPAVVFKKELENAMKKKYFDGIYGTGKKVTDRLLSIYIKKTNEDSTQTESLDETFKIYENNIKNLELKIVQMDIENAQLKHDEENLRDRIRFQIQTY